MFCVNRCGRIDQLQGLDLSLVCDAAVFDLHWHGVRTGRNCEPCRQAILQQLFGLGRVQWVKARLLHKRFSDDMQPGFVKAEYAAIVDDDRTFHLHLAVL